jgi:hypothetical protein
MRGVSELPFHLTEAAEWDELCKTLTSFRFMERKAAKVSAVQQSGETVHMGVFQLEDDFEFALRRMQRAD